MAGFNNLEYLNLQLFGSQEIFSHIITTVKNLKVRTPEKFAVITLNVEQFGFMTE